jgi:phytoene synthase
MAPHGQTVMETVRGADPDRYLSVLYAPEHKRPALFALYAFNAEIAAIRDRVRETLPGEVRIQWWQEVIDADSPRAADGHPVAEALLAAIGHHGLPRAAFARYLDARLFDLFNDPMPSRADLEGYCGETASTIIQLAALILDPEKARRYADMAGHAGCAQAITGLLRLLPLHRARGQCYVPLDILDAVSVTPERFLAGEAAAKSAIAAMVSLATEHFDKFRREAKTLSAAASPAFLPVALVPAYIGAISRNADPFSTQSEISALRRSWTMLRRASRGW